MAATEWVDLDPTRESDYELFRAADEAALRGDREILTMLSQGVFSYTNGPRYRCFGCYWKPFQVAQMAWLHGVRYGFFSNALRTWSADFGKWRGVNGMEAYAHRFERRVCEDCGQEVP